MDDRLERVLFTASGSVRTSRTGAYRSERRRFRAEQRTAAAASVVVVNVGFKTWDGNQWHLLAFRPNPASNSKPSAQNLYPIFDTIQFTTLIVSQDVQHRMQSAISCSACTTHSQTSPADSTRCTRHSPTMIHTRRTLQGTRLLVCLTFLNGYKWTLSRSDINLQVHHSAVDHAGRYPVSGAGIPVEGARS